VKFAKQVDYEVSVWLIDGSKHKATGLKIAGFAVQDCKLPLRKYAVQLTYRV